MDCSTPGLPVLLELAQTLVHGIGDAIQPSHPVVPFSSSLQSFPASGSFPLSGLFASGGQSIGISVSASVLPMNIQDCFPLGLTGLIYQHHSSKASVLWCSAFFTVQLSHPPMTTGSNSHSPSWTHNALDVKNRGYLPQGNWDAYERNDSVSPDSASSQR